MTGAAGTVAVALLFSAYFLSTVEPRYNEGPKGLAKFVRDNQVPLCEGYFSYTLLLLG